MTNDKTVTMSRELAEQLLHFGDTQSTITPYATAWLRTVLAAPVVEPQCSEVNPQCSELLRTQAPVVERHAEPIYQTCNGVDGWIDVDLLRFTARQLDPEEYECRVLYTSPPAPVAVVDPCDWSDGQILDFLGVALRNVDLSGEVKLSEIRQGFEYVRQNACLDKVKEMNR